MPLEKRLRHSIGVSRAPAGAFAMERSGWLKRLSPCTQFGLAGYDARTAVFRGMVIEVDSLASIVVLDRRGTSFAFGFAVARRDWTTTRPL